MSSSTTSTLREIINLVWAQVTTSLGSTCSDDSNCLPGMECRPWTSGQVKNEGIAVTICQCPTTHRVLNNTQCVPRRLGDPCSGSDSDCGLILDAVCSRDTLTCSCPSSHQATQTLVNATPMSSSTDTYSPLWQLVDACRPVNGATKRVGQRCTNSLQCQFGHMCARCEPKNLVLPKTCNRPSCSSQMCRNQTCPLCAPESPPATTFTTSTTPAPPPLTAPHEVADSIVFETTTTTQPSPILPDVAAHVRNFWEETSSSTSTTTAPTVKVEEVESGVNVALAVTLPLLFLIIGLIGIGLFLKYAWGRLDWRRRGVIRKCVEALETASSSASSGLSMNRPQFNSENMAVSDISAIPNVSYYGGPSSQSDLAYTQSSATVLIRELEGELELDSNLASIKTNPPAGGGGNNQFSALTMNFNTSDLVSYRSRQHVLSQSMHRIHHPQINSSRSDIGCAKHKFCFNNNIDDDDDGYIGGSDLLPPRLPYRSKSIRALPSHDYPEDHEDDHQSNHNHLHHHHHHHHPHNHHHGMASNLVSSRLDLDRRKSLQY